MVVDDRRDRLVLPPGASLGAWWRQTVGVLRGTWRPLAPVLLVSVTLPAAAVQVASALARSVWWLPVALVVAAAAVAFGWTASAFVMTRWAAALSHRPGSALRYAAWRFPRVGPWTLLAGAAIGAGLVLLALPGLGLLLMWSVALPAASFERNNPLVRSWRLVRTALEPVTARTALLVAGALAWTAATQALGYAVAPADGWPRTVVVAGATALLGLPAVAVTFAGTLVTFAELRGSERPVRAVTLAGELESPRLIVADPARS